MCEDNLCLNRWNRRPLSERQLTYAALDALASVLIYDSLARRDPGFIDQAAAALVSRQQSLQPASSAQNARGKKRALGSPPGGTHCA